MFKTGNCESQTWNTQIVPNWLLYTFYRFISYFSPVFYNRRKDSFNNKIVFFFNLFYSLLHSQVSIKDGFSLENKYTQIL